jgi:hypothetical protein
MRASSLCYLLLALTPLWSVADEAAPPSLALLEYLGEWQDEEGNTIDPQALALLQQDGPMVGGKSNDEE